MFSLFCIVSWLLGFRLSNKETALNWLSVNWKTRRSFTELIFHLLKSVTLFLWEACSLMSDFKCLPFLSRIYEMCAIIGKSVAILAVCTARLSSQMASYPIVAWCMSPHIFFHACFSLHWSVSHFIFILWYKYIRHVCLSFEPLPNLQSASALSW